MCVCAATFERMHRAVCHVKVRNGHNCTVHFASHRIELYNPAPIASIVVFPHNEISHKGLKRKAAVSFDAVPEGGDRAHHLFAMLVNFSNETVVVVLR